MATRRSTIHVLSRIIICVIVAVSLGTLLWQPPNRWVYALDILLRSWLLFLGTVMAHEGTHGHLGRSKSANLWWGRLALIPNMVPFLGFRKTHHLHHRHTNLPESDPDFFLKPRWHVAEIPFRAVLMPHQWIPWLWKRNHINRHDLVDLLLNYAGILLVFGWIASQVGLERVLWGMVPTLVLVSLLLWYPFAYKTHEGYSTGAEETRSHNYYGWFMYWFSLGLSMHRVHHMQPHLPWWELRHFVRSGPPGRRFLPRRDIRHSA